MQSVVLLNQQLWFLRIDDVISMKGAKGAGMPDMSGMMG